MAIYVDLEKAVSLAKSLEPNFGFLSKPLIDAVQEIIRQASPEDVTPVIHAKWIKRDDGWGDIYYDCSACNESWTTIEGTPFDNDMKYCPHCGARCDL